MKVFRMTRRAAIGAWLVAWSIVVLWAAVTSLHYNPLSPGLSAERRTRLVLPEGWGFFTRNPRERDLVVVYRDGQGHWEVEPPHASARNLFGMSRVSRAVPVEAIRLLEGVKQPFADCSGSWQDCLEAAPPVVVVNREAKPVLCGDVGFFRRAPVPWAWAKQMTPEEMPTDFLRTQIRCNHDPS